MLVKSTWSDLAQMVERKALNLVVMGSSAMVGDHWSRTKMLLFLLVNNICKKLQYSKL